MELSLATLDSSNSIRLSRLMSSSRRLTRVWWSILTAIDSLASPDTSDGMSSCREMSIVSSEKKLGFDFLLITFCQRQKWWHKLLSYLFLLMVLCNEVGVCGFSWRLWLIFLQKFHHFHFLTIIIFCQQGKTWHFCDLMSTKLHSMQKSCVRESSNHPGTNELSERLSCRQVIDCAWLWLFWRFTFVSYFLID